MLRQRVITALVLLALLLPALFASSPLPFALFTGVLISAAGWEWARLNGCGPQRSLAAGLALAVGLLVFWQAGGVERSWRELWLVVGVLWVLMAAALLYRGVDAYARWPQMLRLWLGLFLIACAWLALVQARLLGLGFLLSVLLLVWVADIAAYFAGKRFGRRKLAPAISPGKTWEGVAGAIAGVLAYGIALGPNCYAGILETTEDGGYPVLERLRLILGGRWSGGDVDARRGLRALLRRGLLDRVRVRRLGAGRAEQRDERHAWPTHLSARSLRASSCRSTPR